MTDGEKKRLEALVKLQFEGDAIVVPSFTASQIAFIERLIDMRIDKSLSFDVSDEDIEQANTE